MSQKLVVEDVRNPLEVRILKELNHLKRGTKWKNLSYEDEYLPYITEHSYIPDFILTRSDGTKLYIEVKGWLRKDDQKKLIAVKKYNPDIDIRIVFDKDNKLSARHKMRYSGWAIKYKFPYAIGGIPKEWLVPTS